MDHVRAVCFRIASKELSGADACYALNDIAVFCHEDGFDYGERDRRLEEAMEHVGKFVPEEETDKEKIYFKDLEPMFGKCTTGVPEEETDKEKIYFKDPEPMFGKCTTASAAKRVKRERSPDSDDASSGSEEEACYIELEMGPTDPYYALLRLPQERRDALDDAMVIACAGCGFSYNGLILAARASEYGVDVVELEYYLLNRSDMRWLIPSECVKDFPSEMMILL